WDTTRSCRPPPPAPLLLVRQPDPGVAAEPLAVVVGLQSGRRDAVHGELRITVLGVARHPDRADNLALRVADLQAAALGKDLVAARADEITHEDRLLLGAHLDELRGAPHRQRRIGFAVSHLE